MVLTRWFERETRGRGHVTERRIACKNISVRSVGETVPQGVVRRPLNRTGGCAGGLMEFPSKLHATGEENVSQALLPCDPIPPKILMEPGFLLFSAGGENRA